METEMASAQKKDLPGITFLFAFYVILTSSFSANPVDQPQASQAVYDSVAVLDSPVFAALCNNKLEKSSPSFAEDIGFFHDKGGFNKSCDAVLEMLKEDFFRKQKAFTVQREFVKESLKLYPSNDDGVASGALQTGKQSFYETGQGRKERLAGIARFNHLWINNERKWKISRLISYGHRVFHVRNGAGDRVP